MGESLLTGELTAGDGELPCPSGVDVAGYGLSVVLGELNGGCLGGTDPLPYFPGELGDPTDGAVDGEAGCSGG